MLGRSQMSKQTVIHNGYTMVIAKKFRIDAPTTCLIVGIKLSSLGGQ